MSRVAITISDTAAIRTPRSCVVCGRVETDRLTEVTGVTSRLSSRFTSPFGANRRFRFPVHESCERRLRRRTVARYLLLAAMMTAVQVLAMSCGIGWAASLCLSLPILLLLSVSRVLCPLPVEFEHACGKITFRFANLRFARVFAKLNRRAREKGNQPPIADRMR